MDECLQQLKKSGILHEEQSKDGKADDAEDQEVIAIKGRGRGNKNVFNKDKFWEVVPDETLFSCSRQESGYPVNAKHAGLERRSAHQL